MDPTEDNEFTHVPDDALRTYLQGLDAYIAAGTVRRDAQMLLVPLAFFGFGFFLRPVLDAAGGSYTAIAEGVYDIGLLVSWGLLGLAWLTRHLVTRRAGRIIAGLTWPQAARLRYLGVKHVADGHTSNAHKEEEVDHGRVAP